MVKQTTNIWFMLVWEINAKKYVAYCDVLLSPRSIKVYWHEEISKVCVRLPWNFCIWSKVQRFAAQGVPTANTSQDTICKEFAFSPVLVFVSSGYCGFLQHTDILVGGLVPV